MRLLQTEEKDIRIHRCGPLYRHLCQCVMPDLDVDTKDPSFNARSINRQAGVYLFEEKKSEKVFIGKFFGSRRHILESEQRRLVLLGLGVCRVGAGDPCADQTGERSSTSHEADDLLGVL